MTDEPEEQAADPAPETYQVKKTRQRGKKLTGDKLLGYINKVLFCDLGMGKKERNEFIDQCFHTNGEIKVGRYYLLFLLKRL